MEWWAAAYFIILIVIGMLGLNVLVREQKATFGRVALLVCSTASLFASAWAYWEPDAAMLREIDVQRLFVVAVVLAVGETVWAVLDLRESEENIARADFMVMVAGVTLGSLLILLPALWWGYQAAFGERKESVGTCPIGDQHEGRQRQGVDMPAGVSGGEERPAGAPTLSRTCVPA